MISIGFSQEYHCLLDVFSKCHQCINARRFRLLFTRPIRQSIRFYLEQKSNSKVNQQELEQLNETLIDLCFQFEMNDEVNEILQITTKNTCEQLTDNMQSLTVANQRKNETKRSSAMKTYDRSVE